MSDETPGRPSPTELREYRWWVERYGADDPARAPMVDADPRNLAETGWGALFAHDVSPEVREALSPLLRHRREMAGRFYKEFTHRQGASKMDFLAEQKARPGPADPRSVPYYLLIVGDPQAVPFRFQYEMDVQYGVGRICFERAEDYAKYAESVIRAETEPPSRPKRLGFFGVENNDDPATRATSRELVLPLAETITHERPDWAVRRYLGGQATKAQLGQLLGGGETPAVLFTAGHGMRFRPEDTRQLYDQGALLCHDWPGPEDWHGPIPSNFYFSATDVSPDADLAGLIAFFFADYGAGTPDVDNFYSLNKPERVAPYPFIARLPQRLLSHPRGGALAVVAHIDKAWTTTFLWNGSSQIELYRSTLQRLLLGYPVGSAMEYFNQHHAELAVELSHLWEDRDSLTEVSRAHFDRVWRAAHDARNFVVLGDPAVRLTFQAE